MYPWLDRVSRFSQEGRTEDLEETEERASATAQTNKKAKAPIISYFYLCYAITLLVFKDFQVASIVLQTDLDEPVGSFNTLLIVYTNPPCLNFFPHVDGDGALNTQIYTCAIIKQTWALELSKFKFMMDFQI